jgi:hypothetical protein
MDIAARVLILRVGRLLRRAERRRRAELEEQLSGYVTAAERRDLMATLDRYPDAVTHEMRSILAGRDQARPFTGGCGMRPLR